MEVYVGKSPVGPVILASRAPIMKNGLMSKRYDETPVNVADVIRMTGAVLKEKRQESRGGDLVPTDNDLLVHELEIDSTAGCYCPPPVMSCSESGFPTAGGGHSGGNKVYRSVNVGGCSPELTGLCSKKRVSRELAKQNRLAIGDATPKI